MQSFSLILLTAESQLRNAPAGEIHTFKSNGTTQFYCRTENGSRQYLSKNKEEAIKALAQKLYNKEIIKQKHNPTCLIDVYKTFPEALKPFITPYDLPVEEKVKKWTSEKYKQNSKFPEGLRFHTDKGDLVRSKSELLIANKLFGKHIPYRYECELQLKNNLTLFPDFTIMNPNTGEIFILEHFGLLDKPEYAELFVKKMHIYAKNNYLLGKNLLCTFETTTNPFSTEYIDLLINTYLYG